MKITRRSSILARGSGKNVCCRRCYSISSLRRSPQWFVEDPLIVLDLVPLDDAPKSEDGRPRKEGTLKMVT